MANFRGAFLSFNGGSTVIGRNSSFNVGSVSNGLVTWVARKGLSPATTSSIPCGKTNLPLSNSYINCKPLSTLACKRFPILSFRSSGKGKVDVYSLWNHGVGLQTNRSFTSSSATCKSIQLPVCIHPTTRTSEVSVSIG